MHGFVAGVVAVAATAAAAADDVPVEVALDEAVARISFVVVVVVVVFARAVGIAGDGMAENHVPEEQ